MQNVIQKLLSHVYHNIPREILQEAFIPKNDDNSLSLDTYIEQIVITQRVLLDCNLFAGKKKRLLLQHDFLEKVKTPKVYSTLAAGYTGVYRIPPEEREYRDIAYVIELLYPFSASGYNHITIPPTNAYGMSATSKTMDVLNSHTYGNVANPPRPILLAGDLIKLDPPQLTHIDWILVCALKYDKEFTSLNNDAIYPLSELVLCATKSYIYNTLILKIDKAYITQGQELGRFREIIERYESEHEKYKELLDKFRGTATLDREIISDMVAMMFG